VWCASMGFGQVPTLVPLLEGAGVRRAVFLSSTAIFTSLPARSRGLRLAAERAVRASALDWTLLRPTMIYGSARDRNVSRLLQLVRRTPLLPIVAGSARHQPIFVDDLADAVVTALGSSVAIGRAYNLGGADALRFDALVREAAEAAGRCVRLVPVPCWLASVAAELVPDRPVSVEQIRRLAEDKAVDIGPAQRDLGFRPRTFAAGVRREAQALGLAPLH